MTNTTDWRFTGSSVSGLGYGYSIVRDEQTGGYGVALRLSVETEPAGA